MMAEKKYFIRLLLITLLCGTGAYFAKDTAVAGLISPHIGFIIVFFVLSTLLFHTAMLRAEAVSPKHFIRAFMGGTSLKLFLYLIVIICYGVLNRTGAKSFILDFLVLYLIYFVFEIASLLKYFKKG